MENVREQLNQAFENFALVKESPDRYFKMLQSIGQCRIRNKSESWELVGRANYEILTEIKQKHLSRTEEGQSKISRIKGITQENPKSIPDFVLRKVKEIKIREYFATLPEGYKF